MYLLDTNIWLERLLGQQESATVGELLAALPLDQVSLTDFTLHSIGVILHRLGYNRTYLQFVQDVLIDGDITMFSLQPAAMQRVVAVMEQFGLDFDDAYQYTVAEREDVSIVSFDKHFDRTDRGSITPEQLLKKL
jgi:predicted nucleic acid-binding protein